MNPDKVTTINSINIILMKPMRSPTLTNPTRRRASLPIVKNRGNMINTTPTSISMIPNTANTRPTSTVTNTIPQN